MRKRRGASKESRPGAAVDPPLVVVAVVLLVILIAGAAVRVQAVPSRFGPHECAGGDVYRYYVSVASSVLEGRGWITDYEWNFIPPPGQAAFIVLARSILPGADFQTLRYLQAIFGILTIALAFWVGLRMGGRWVGLVAAVILALDPNVIEYTAVLLAETNYFFLLFLFLGLLLEAARRGSIAWSTAAGGALALASLTKSFPMLLSLLIPLYLVVRGQDRRAALQALGFFLGFAVVVSPWLVRNYVRYDQVYPISTNAGTLMAQSNFRELDSGDPDQIYWEQIYREDGWKSPEIEAAFEGQVDRYGRPEWNEKDRAYMRYAMRYIADNPAHFTRNYAIKLYNVLRYPLPGRGENWRPSHGYRILMLLLGLVGLARFAVAERDKPQWILIPVFFYFLAFTALLHIVRSGRINLPVKVLLGLFAAYLLGRVVERAAGSWRRGKKGKRR